MNAGHVERLLSDFALGTLVDFLIDQEGWLNRNFFLVTSSGKYFVKSVREEIKERLVYISTVEEFMRGGGVPAICMLPAANGQKHVEYDSRIYTVYPFVESDRSRQYGTDDYVRMGRLLGDIHRQSARGIPDLLYTRMLSLERSIPSAIKALKKYKSRIRSKGTLEELDRKTLEYIDLKLELASRLTSRDSIPCDTLVHGDYHQGNLFVDPQSREIIGICDWEKAEVGPRAYELAQSILHIHFRGKYEIGNALKNTKSYVEGYSSVFPINRKDFEQGLRFRLQHLILTQWLEYLLYVKCDCRLKQCVGTEKRRLTDLTEGDLAGELAMLFDY